MIKKKKVCMSDLRSLNPKSTFKKDGKPDMIEMRAWADCVDMAFLYTETYDMSAIPIPFAGFDYTYTHSYYKGIKSRYPDGYIRKYTNTYFYNKP